MRYSVVLLAMLLSGCAPFRTPPNVQQPGPAGGIPHYAFLSDLEGDEKPAGATHAYALLYDLLGDEKDVSKLGFIKHERSELKELVKEISRTSAEAHKQLEAFAKADSRLNLKDLGLPVAEIETRKAIGKTKTKALLTDKGKEFEVQLLLSQSEALTYGAHLALTTGRTEAKPQRAQFLQRLANDLTQLQQKVVSLLLANYVWREAG